MVAKNNYNNNYNLLETQFSIFRIIKTLIKKILSQKSRKSV